MRPDGVEDSPGAGTELVEEAVPVGPLTEVVDAGRLITAGGIASGMALGFHLLRRASFDEGFVADVARIMEYSAAYDLYRDDRLIAGESAMAAESRQT